MEGLLFKYYWKFLLEYWIYFSESEVAQSCPILCHPMDCSLPHSSVHGIFQARVLEWVAISFPRGSSWPRDQTWVSHIVGRRFTVWITKEVSCCRVSFRTLSHNLWALAQPHFHCWHNLLDLGSFAQSWLSDLKNVELCVVFHLIGIYWWFSHY